MAKNSSGSIIWSWHIWVSDADLAALAVNSGDASAPYHILPRALGSVTDGTESLNGYQEGLARVKAVQRGGTASVEFLLRRKGKTYWTADKTYVPLYQWGRKDPFLPHKVDDSGQYVARAASDYCVASGASAFATQAVGRNTQYGLAWAAANPTVFGLRVTTSGSANDRWYCEEISTNTRANYRNLWNAAATTDAEGTNDITYRAVVKTVYDPCPPGFCVPAAIFSNIEGMPNPELSGQFLKNVYNLNGNDTEYRFSVYPSRNRDDGSFQGSPTNSSPHMWLAEYSSNDFAGWYFAPKSNMNSGMANAFHIIPMADTTP